MRSVIARVRKRGLAVWLRDFHLFSVAFWVVMLPFSIITGLWHSIAFVTIISLWALVSTEFGAYQGSRAEVSVITEGVFKA